jgi:predicted enzyme related to lactoylglutathione lyase
MKKVTLLLLVIACVAFLCGTAFSQEERPARPPREQMGPRAEEARKLTQRLRELNTALREATAEARQSEKVQKASERVRVLQEKLRSAQQKTREAMDKVIVKANPDLAGAVKERREIEEKLRELRGGIAPRDRGVPGPDRSRPARPEPQAQEAPPQEAEEASLGSIVLFEIPVDDAERARTFYSELFEWKIERTPGPTEYWLIPPKSEKAVPGGMMQRQDPHQTIADYFAVPSIDEYIAKVEKLGGKIVVPKMPVAGVGYFAYCRDTENNVFAIWETNPDAK